MNNQKPSPAREAAAYLGGGLAVIIVVCLVIGLLFGDYMGADRTMTAFMDRGTCVIEAEDAVGNTHILSGKPAMVSVD